MHHHRSDETRAYSVMRKLFIEIVGADNFKTIERQCTLVDSLVDEAFVGQSDEAISVAKENMRLILSIDSPRPLSEVPAAVKPAESSILSSFTSLTALPARHIPKLDLRAGTDGTARLRIAQTDVTFMKVLCALLGDRRTVIVIEDAHFCDELSWVELEKISRREGFYGLGVLLTMTSSAKAGSVSVPTRASGYGRGSGSTNRIASSEVTRQGQHRQGSATSASAMAAMAAAAWGQLLQTDFTGSHAPVVLSTASCSSAVVDDTTGSPEADRRNTHELQPINKYAGCRFRTTQSCIALLEGTQCVVIQMHALTRTEVKDVLTHELRDILTDGLKEGVTDGLIDSVFNVTAGRLGSQAANHARQHPMSTR